MLMRIGIVPGCSDWAKGRQSTAKHYKHEACHGKAGCSELGLQQCEPVVGGTVFKSVWPAYTLEQLEFITCMRACKLALALLLSLKGAYVDARFISRFIIATSDCCALAH